MPNPDELAARLGLTWFDYQLPAFDRYLATPSRRTCLFFRTGAGKTFTALACIALDELEGALVIAPPRIHKQWVDAAKMLGLKVKTISHAKWRMKDFRPDIRNTAVIVDEFHLLGGVKGDGWRKFRDYTDHSTAPIIIMSATPYWNSAERIYCARRIMERGNLDFLEFLYATCNLKPNRYGILPEVIGFKDYGHPWDYLADLPYVSYLRDDRVVDVVDVDYPEFVPNELRRYGMDRRRGRLIASRIEEYHARKRFNLIEDNGMLRDEVWDVLVDLVGQAQGPVLVYCESSQVGQVAFDTMAYSNADVALLTGKTPKRKADELIARFRAGKLDVLIGTATMRTGTDGFDKICDTLIILDDTQDDAGRDQLIGRILPRGVEASYQHKRFYRLVPS